MQVICCLCSGITIYLMVSYKHLQTSMRHRELTGRGRPQRVMTSEAMLILWALLCGFFTGGFVSLVSPVIVSISDNNLAEIGCVLLPSAASFTRDVLPIRPETCLPVQTPTRDRLRPHCRRRSRRQSSLRTPDRESKRRLSRLDHVRGFSRSLGRPGGARWQDGFRKAEGHMACVAAGALMREGHVRRGSEI